MKELNTALLLGERMAAGAAQDWDFLPASRNDAPTEGSAARDKVVAAASKIEPPEEFQSEAATSESPFPQQSVVRRRNKFQRSVSIGSPRSREWSPVAQSTVPAAAVLAQRKRNSSHEEQCRGLGGASSNTAEFLAHTSPAWKRLFEMPATAESGNSSIAAKLMESPVIGFLLQWNDLESVRLAMQFSLRKAVCRAYAMQAYRFI